MGPIGHWRRAAAVRDLRAVNTTGGIEASDEPTTDRLVEDQDSPLSVLGGYLEAGAPDH